MGMYRTKWALGTEARLMFDILHYTFLRLGDAHASGRRISARSCGRWPCRSRPRRTVATPPSRFLCTRSLRKACGRRARPASRRRGLLRLEAERPRATDEQEGVGNEVQEVRGVRRRQ